jgi:hypothetical protein
LASQLAEIVVTSQASDSNKIRELENVTIVVYDRVLQEQLQLQQQQQPQQPQQQQQSFASSIHDIEVVKGLVHFFKLYSQIRPQLLQQLQQQQQQQLYQISESLYWDSLRVSLGGERVCVCVYVCFYIRETNIRLFLDHSNNAKTRTTSIRCCSFFIRCKHRFWQSTTTAATSSIQHRSTKSATIHSSRSRSPINISRYNCSSSGGTIGTLSESSTRFEIEQTTAGKRKEKKERTPTATTTI